jgi:hypothetical protein
MTHRWIRRPEGSNWGDFGADDQLGRINLLTPERVRRAALEIQEGRNFCLSLPLDYPGGSVLNPNRHPPVLRPTLRHGLVNFNFKLADIDPSKSDVLSDDLVILHLQYSTQWDGLAHVGSMFDADHDGLPEAVYYNGFRAAEHVTGPSDARDAGASTSPGAVSTSSARALGIENMARTSVQGRGVMINLHAHFGAARKIVGFAELMHVLEADRIQIEEGDMVCLHTGFSEAILAMNHQPDADLLALTGCVLDGRDTQLLNWITESGLAVLIADNYAVEAYPAKPGPACCAALPLHEHCLFKLGVHLGELWRLSPLASYLREQHRSRFFLTAPPLNLPGAIASPATPVATV